MSIHFWDKNVKEIRYGQKKVKEVWYGDKKVWPSEPSINLDPNSDQPIGRMHDGELWFRVNVKDPNEKFKIAVNGYNGQSYDWDISVDWSPAIRKQGNKSTLPIQIHMPRWKHIVKVTPHNGVTAWWARCLGNGTSSNFWNSNQNKLEFSLEWLPWYAFMESETKVGDDFLRQTWSQCPTLVSLPNWFNLPQGVTSVDENFLYGAWEYCVFLTSIPNWFNIPQGITSVGTHFLGYTWRNCRSLRFMPNWFNLPQGITSVGTHFLFSTWSNCKSLTSMPNWFNIPQGVTSVELNFCSTAWIDCTSLISMPSWFNIPQGFTKVGRNFFNNTWRWCSSLTSDSPAEPINFPNVNWTNYASYCFWTTCPITPDSPTPWSSVMIKRSS